MDLIQQLLQDRTVAIFFLTVCGMLSVFFARCLVGALYGMHRSRSTMKKLAKAYSLWDKVLLKDAWENCLHAKGFCRKLIVFYRLRLAIMLLSLLLYVTPILGCLTLVVLVAMDIPMAILYRLLETDPLNIRHRGYRFEKYKNTGEREKLF